MTTIIEVPKQELLERLDRDGWVTGWGEVQGDGPTCLHGHIRRCRLQPGDAYIIQQVYAHREEGSMAWNDEQPNVGAVRSWVVQADLDVTDSEMAEVFGPNWKAVVALARRAAVLTPGEAEALNVARYGARYGAWDAWDAAQSAAATQGAARGAARRVAWGAVWGAVRGVTWDPQETVTALVVCDLVGQHGLEQHHIETLLGPWITVCGDPREVQS